MLQMRLSEIFTVPTLSLSASHCCCCCCCGCNSMLRISRRSSLLAALCCRYTLSNTPCNRRRQAFKGEGKRFLHGALICRCTVRIHIWHLCRRFMHYERKKLITKSRDFVSRYLFTARWRHRLDRLRKEWLVTPQCSVVKCFWCSLRCSRMYKLLLQGCER